MAGANVVKGSLVHLRKERGPAWEIDVRGGADLDAARLYRIL